MKRRRSKNFKSFLVLISLLILVSCSSSDNTLSGSIPKVDSENYPQNERELLGVFQLKIDTSAGTVEISPDRKLAGHWNVTDWLNPPNCFDCMKIEVLNHKPGIKRIFLKVTLRNPTEHYGFNIRGIMMTDIPGFELLNQDGYTDLWDSGTPPLINPFKTFFGQEWKTALSYVDAGEEVTRYYHIEYPSFGSLLTVSLVVDATWPFTAYAKEAWWIRDCLQVDNLSPSGGDTFVRVYILVQEYAPLNDVSKVYVDATPIGGGIISVDNIIDQCEFYLAYFPISISQYNPPGVYKLLIWVEMEFSDVVLYDYLDIFIKEPSAPLEYVSEIIVDPSGGYRCMAVHGSYLFVWISHLHVFDISNPEQTVFVADYGIMADDVYIENDVMYCYDGATGIPRVFVYDVSNPENITEMMQYWGVPPDGTMCGWTDYIYISGMSTMGIDISDPLQPKVVLNDSNQGNHSISCNESYLCISNDFYRIWLYDNSDPSAPVYIDQLDLLSWRSTLAQKDDHLFASGWLDTKIYDLAWSNTDPGGVMDRIYGNIYTYEDELLAIGNGIYIYDINDPEEPDLKSWYSGDFIDAAMNDDYIYALSYGPGSSVNTITTLKRD